MVFKLFLVFDILVLSFLKGTGRKRTNVTTHGQPKHQMRHKRVAGLWGIREGMGFGPPIA